VDPYTPYDLFQTTGETCAKFGSDRFINVDLYKVQTYKQTNIFIYKISVYLKLFSYKKTSSKIPN
jgi:hypothetical protein